MLNFGGVQATDVHNEDLFAWHTIDMNHRGQCIQWLGTPHQWPTARHRQIDVFLIC